jgi:predicted  nucleic acid-binding Zn-ribbon protein
MQEFTDERQQLDALRDRLDAVQEQMTDIEEDSDDWRQLRDEADRIQLQISALESDEKRLNYFLDVGDMLFQYFDAQESVASGAAVPKVTAPVHMPSNSILSYFMAPAAAEPPSPESKKIPSPRSKASDIDSSEGMNRDKMLERYLATVEPTAIEGGIMPGSGIEPGWGSCPVCSVEMTFYQNEAMLGCPKCGHEEFILIDSEKPSYKDPPREISYFAYKKINHFNEWLAQFQAKENTDIPQEVLEAIMKELKKERISDPKRVKKEKILEILRKLKMPKMYDHVQQIKNRIQHQMTNLTLSKEMEEKLQYLFKEIQPAWIKFCPRDRSNFLSYPYVLYKLCQLLDMDDFLPYFQLLKSREKLYQQDQTWEKICKEMQWQFIRSI